MSSFNGDDDDRAPFLNENEKESDRSVNKTIRQARDYKWFILSIALLSIVVHAALLVLWMGPKNPTVWNSEGSLKSWNLYTPFREVIDTKVEIWPEDAWDNSMYTGRPSKKVDEAWNKLQAVEGISVSPEEVAQLNLTSSIKLKNGDQAVVVGYFHNLHCIRYLYQGLHPETYPRDSDDESHSGLHHSYHCLEVLRRSVLCQPDLTLHAIHWQDEQKLGMTLEPESTRECVNFEAVYNFSMTRRFKRDMIIDVENSVYDD